MTNEEKLDLILAALARIEDRQKAVKEKIIESLPVQGSFGSNDPD